MPAGIRAGAHGGVERGCGNSLGKYRCTGSVVGDEACTVELTYLVPGLLTLPFLLKLTLINRQERSLDLDS
nr:hypothetical protein [Tanacetum cinerariifolium]